MSAIQKVASKRYEFSVASFRGVDLSVPALQVAAYRAVAIENFMFRDGVVQKRSPWRQMAQVPSFSYYPKGATSPRQNGFEIHAIWRFVAEDGAEHVIAHVDRILFEVLHVEGDYKTVRLAPLYKTVYSNGTAVATCDELLSKKVSAFVSGNRLWILGGTRFYVLRFPRNALGDDWEGYAMNSGYMAPVEDIAYVPVTTIAVCEKDSPVSTGNVNLDDVNLLTPLRTNKLLTGTISDDAEIVRHTRFHEFQLDADVCFAPSGSTEDITVVINHREAE